MPETPFARVLHTSLTHKQGGLRGIGGASMVSFASPDRSARTSADPMRDQQEFGPYRVTRQIARGGMAEIYLARQRGLEGIERTVVVKRILERYAHDAEFITMFLDEARLMAALSHPNIAQVFDVGKLEPSTYYLVMEHVRGPTLGKLLQAARAAGAAGLPRREALGIGLGVAEALHYVHERRDELGRSLDIVHRDLNPANVIVSYDGAVKLIDFGIAKAATKVYETRTGVIKGTYGYIAPEQLVGNTPVDRRADVFALGILLYEMCVGEHPYDVSDEPNLVDRILEARYRRARTVRPDIPAELDRIITSCLAPHPEGRPDSVAVVIEGLAAHLGEQRMVPTQHAIAALARELVPDDEGPRPLKRPTAVERPGRRPFGDEPTGTRKVARPAATPPEPRDEWTLDTTPQVDELDTRPVIDDPHGLGPEDEPPTSLMPRADPLVPDPGMIDDDPLTSLMPAVASPARAPSDSETWVPSRRRMSSVARWVAPLLGLAGLLGAGLVAFVATRALGGRDAEAPLTSEAPPLPHAPARSQAPEAQTLRVVSEPPGARVHLDGRPAEGVTPLVIPLPSGARQVWLRLSKTGYLDQEREVSAAAGEARFVLTPVVR